MIQIYNELLKNNDKKELQNKHENINFCTIAYTENAKLPLIISENGVSVGKINTEILDSDF